MPADRCAASPTQSFIQCRHQPRALHSFPPRRSSDLADRAVAARLDIIAATNAAVAIGEEAAFLRWVETRDRKSTRLNSSHVAISYAVFGLKKKKTSNTGGPEGLLSSSQCLGWHGAAD